LSMLAEKVHDDRFIKLVRTMLEAGYLEDWRYGEALSGTPQGGIATPTTILRTTGLWRRRSRGRGSDRDTGKAGHRAGCEGGSTGTRPRRRHPAREGPKRPPRLAPPVLRTSAPARVQDEPLAAVYDRLLDVGARRGRAQDEPRGPRPVRASTEPGQPAG